MSQTQNINDFEIRLANIPIEPSDPLCVISDTGSSPEIVNIWQGLQSEYDTIQNPSSNTIYFIRKP